jgi:regulator of RNase E activity RraA
MLFPVAQLVADLSRTMTLRAGDIILTGTPAGAPVVQPGDVVEVELVGAGRLRNRVVEAPAPLAPVGAMPVASPTARAAAYGPGPRNQPLPPATAALLRRVGTATLSSQLRSRGIDQHSIDGLRPSRPDLRLLGFARTLRYLPLREDVFGRLGGGHNAQKHAVDTLEPDEVLVIDARGEPGAGTVGDILVRRAIRLGAAGVVTDGGLRDTPIVSELDIPVYYRAPHPAVLGRRHVPVDADLPIACGGALVVPGDVLVGDGDGVVVLPRALADEVAAGAAEQERAEQFIAEQVEAGVPLDGLYPMDPATRARYEQWVAERDAADRAAGGTA